MRFNDNQVDFYDGLCAINGIFIEHINKITIGLSDIYIYRSNNIICYVPIDNLKECYVEEILDDGYKAKEERYITKWIKETNELILKQLAEDLKTTNNEEDK